MRYLASVLVIAVLIGTALWVWRMRPQESRTVSILAVALPNVLASGERVALFGGLRFPDGLFEIGTWACQPSGCRRVSWAQVEGPTDRWGGLGTIWFDGDLGSAWVEVRIFERDRIAERVVATWQRDVAVVAPPAGP